MKKEKRVNDEFFSTAFFLSFFNVLIKRDIVLNILFIFDTYWVLSDNINLRGFLATPIIQTLCCVSLWEKVTTVTSHFHLVQQINYKLWSNINAGHMCTANYLASKV